MKRYTILGIYQAHKKHCALLVVSIKFCQTINTFENVNKYEMFSYSVYFFNTD